jgi:hypothetical protein
VSGEGWEGFADYCRALAAQQGVGRASLRRDWTNLRALAERVLPAVPDDLVISLLGKAKSAADPEENDLKALVSWAVGKGLIEATELRTALDDDDRASPLYWLAGLSGKSFGERVAPLLCAYWLVQGSDTWKKQPGTAYYDISWHPSESTHRIRMELKASSENPGFRFQQIRDPRYTGASDLDYDLLLCVGVTASTMEFWSIPATTVGDFIDDRTFPNQHGGAKMASNTHWFVTDARTRQRMKPFFCEAVDVRDLILKQMQ